MSTPCTCKTEEEALQRGCTRAGVQMKGKLWEFCAGIGIPLEKSEKFRAYWDGLEPSVPKKTPLPCIFLGPHLGERRSCPSCNGHVEVFLFSCQIYEKCTTHKQLNGLQCCRDCPDKVERSA